MCCDDLLPFIVGYYHYDVLPQLIIVNFQQLFCPERSNPSLLLKHLAI